MEYLFGTDIVGAIKLWGLAAARDGLSSSSLENSSSLDSSSSSKNDSSSLLLESSSPSVTEVESGVC